MPDLIDLLFAPENILITAIASFTGLLNSAFWYVLFRRWNLYGPLFALVPPLQTALFLYGIGSIQMPGYDPSGNTAFWPASAVLVSVLGPMALFHFVSEGPLSREGLHELDKLKLAKFGRSPRGFFLDPGMLVGGPLATYLILRTLDRTEKERHAAITAATADNYRASKYPIFVPATRIKMVLTGVLLILMAIHGIGFPAAVSGDWDVTVFFAVLTLISVAAVALIMNPALSGLTIYQDEVVFLTTRGRQRIRFKDVGSFVGGHWVQANLHNVQRRSKLFETPQGIPPEFKMSGIALAGLLNHMLDDFRRSNSPA